MFFNGKKHDIRINMEIKDILYFSKKKEDIEIYLSSNKYNL